MDMCAIRSRYSGMKVTSFHLMIMPAQHSWRHRHLQIGPTLMCARAAGRHSLSPTESTIAVRVALRSAGNVQAKTCHYLTWGSTRKCEYAMHVGSRKRWEVEVLPYTTALVQEVRQRLSMRHLTPPLRPVVHLDQVPLLRMMMI